MPDLRDLANIERLAEIPAVLASLASRVLAPLNETNVSDRIGKERFARGVVLYIGGERLPFGERLEAWPVAALWS